MNKNGHIDPQEVIQALETIRLEWLEAADGQPLDQIEGNVALILDDVMHGIGLEIEETVTAAD